MTVITIVDDVIFVDHYCVSNKCQSSIPVFTESDVPLLLVVAEAKQFQTVLCQRDIDKLQIVFEFSEVNDQSKQKYLSSIHSIYLYTTVVDRSISLHGTKIFRNCNNKQQRNKGDSIYFFTT